MIAALSADATLGAGVTIIVAVIGLYGVMLSQGRRLKIVKEQVAGANGATLGQDVYGLVKKVERLSVESDERWNVTLQTSETVSKVHANQLVALSAAQDLMKEIASIKQAQSTTDQRLGLLENHTTRELSELRELIRTLQMQMERSSSNTLTPPHGTPAVSVGD